MFRHGLYHVIVFLIFVPFAILYRFGLLGDKTDEALANFRQWCYRERLPLDSTQPQRAIKDVHLSRRIIFATLGFVAVTFGTADFLVATNHSTVANGSVLNDIGGQTVPSAPTSHSVTPSVSPVRSSVLSTPVASPSAAVSAFTVPASASPSASSTAMSSSALATPGPGPSSASAPLPSPSSTSAAPQPSRTPTPSPTSSSPKPSSTPAPTPSTTSAVPVPSTIGPSSTATTVSLSPSPVSTRRHHRSLH